MWTAWYRGHWKQRWGLANPLLPLFLFSLSTLNLSSVTLQLSLFICLIYGQFDIYNVESNGNREVAWRLSLTIRLFNSHSISHLPFQSKPNLTSPHFPECFKNLNEQFYISSGRGCSQSDNAIDWLDDWFSESWLWDFSHVTLAGKNTWIH